MIVTAWNNGSVRTSGAGYGIKINYTDRKRYFHREWETVIISFENETKEIEVKISKVSFWNKVCGELINKEIGKWLIINRLAPWKKGNPPKLPLIPMKSNHFYLKRGL